MKKFSKILSLLLAIAMVFTLCSVSVFAEDAADDLYYYKILYTTEATTATHPAVSFRYAAHGVMEDGTYELLSPYTSDTHQLGENKDALTTEFVFTSKSPIKGVRLLSEGSNNPVDWTHINETANSSGTEYYIDLDPAKQQPGIDNATVIEQARRIEGFADGGMLILSESPMDLVFQFAYKYGYYYVVPVTTRTDVRHHPDFAFTYTGFSSNDDLEMVSPYLEHWLRDDSKNYTSVTEDVWFYSKTPLTDLTVKQMLADSKNWTYDMSEFSIKLDTANQERGIENALRIEEMYHTEYFEDKEPVEHGLSEVVFHVSYAENQLYYYEVDLSNIIEGNGAEFHSGADLYFVYLGESSDGNVNGQELFPLAATEFEKNCKFVIESPDKLENLLLGFDYDNANPVNDWTYSKAVYAMDFYGSKAHSTDPEKPMKITEMCMVMDDAGNKLVDDLLDVDDLEPTRIKFNHEYDYDGGYVEYEIPIVVNIEQAGTAAPGKETFTFAVYPQAAGEAAVMSLDAEVETEFVTSVSPAQVNAYVTTKGTGEHNALLKIKMPAYLETDQFYIVQLPGDDPHWTYDPTEYYMARKYRYEALSENGASGDWYIESYDPNTEEWDYELECAVFHNIYEYSPAPTVEEDDTYTITAKAGNHGEISPEGEVAVKEGRSKTFEFAPDKGYEVSRIVIDGKELSKKRLAEVKLDGEYTFHDVDEDHTIKVSFSKIEEEAKEIPVENEVEEINPNTGAI